jgi:hypothetical protein
MWVSLPQLARRSAAPLERFVAAAVTSDSRTAGIRHRDLVSDDEPVPATGAGATFEQALDRLCSWAWSAAV